MEREAALNTIEFRLRENNTGNFPRGLLLMLRSLTTWLYDSDPLALLSFERPLQTIKSRVRSERSFFEEMIDRMFLSNPHRTTLILQPDRGLRKREEENEYLPLFGRALVEIGTEEEVKNRGIVKVLGSPTAIEGVEKERPGWLKVVKVL
jgi:Zn-dependent M16 (insulinase) family peptidase